MATHADTAAFGFAQTKYDDNGTPIGDLSRNGLTKREYFAAQAMVGLIAMQSENWCSRTKDLVADAVEHADALIAALNAEGQADG